ncbi:MAG: YraN family protein [Cellulosilyticum sp.]|nr:YraN family protein [Cellulosilyticum sp.]
MTYTQKQKDVPNKRVVGSYYETLASEYLVKQGYEIICHNFRSRFGEIDIIAKDHEYIVFIEVKYRKTKQFGYPREAVTYRKQRHIIRTAQYFLLTHIGREQSCRFDVIEILDHQLTHLVAAF